MNEIGIMQGRLSPPVAGRVQAFPWSSWEDEFTRARECGFDTIEWLFEEPRAVDNPLWSAPGRDRIRRRVADSGVSVRSVCADYFMTHPFFRVPDHERTRSVDVLETLIGHARSLGIRTILVPVLEGCEIRAAQEAIDLLKALRRPLGIAHDAAVTIALETELPSSEYRALVEDAGSPALGIYYDVGNAAAKGYDPVADLRALGPWLRGVHVKDRPRGGASVPLGQGDVDFAAFFSELAAVGYGGPLVVQAATGADYLGLSRGYSRLVRHHLHPHGGVAR
ncbi:MAG: sugar phosphate isomerase/epimerase [Acidimicrobiia bacterium]|nr:sugar phosphate isomerase/epimerase [Acidimicrobiia bacterium]